MFRKQYNNNLLFIALVVILLAVIAVFAYLIMKANRGNQEQSGVDTVQNNSASSNEVSQEIMESLNAPMETAEIQEEAEASDSSSNNKIAPEVLESLNTPAETAEVNNLEGSSGSDGTIDPEILKSLNAPSN